MWKKIGKYVLAVGAGGVVGSGAAANTFSLTLPEGTIELLNTILGAIIALVALYSKSPKDE